MPGGSCHPTATWRVRLRPIRTCILHATRARENRCATKVRDFSMNIYCIIIVKVYLHNIMCIHAGKLICCCVVGGFRCAVISLVLTFLLRNEYFQFVMCDTNTSSRCFYKSCTRLLMQYIGRSSVDEPLTKSAATRHDSLVRSLVIALYMGQSYSVACYWNVPAR